MLVGVIVTDALCPASTVPLVWLAAAQTIPIGSVSVMLTCQLTSTLLPVLSIVTVSAESVGQVSEKLVGETITLKIGVGVEVGEGVGVAVGEGVGVDVDVEVGLGYGVAVG